MAVYLDVWQKKSPPEAGYKKLFLRNQGALYLLGSTPGAAVTAVGAVVGNDDGEILLIQRADSGRWLYPTGWADVGYSASEVVVKEVAEKPRRKQQSGTQQESLF